MTNDSSHIDDLLRRARAGDQHALAELFSRHRLPGARLIRKGAE